MGLVMDKENANEWYVLQRRAYEIVREGNEPRQRGMRLCHIAVLPSFECIIGWDIYQRFDKVDEKEYYAIRLTWLRRDDAMRLESPVERLKYPRALEPTILREAVELSSREAKSLLEKFTVISIPAAVYKYDVGLDGTSYEVSLGHFHPCAHYSWWEEPPVAWKPLHDALIDAFEYLEALDRQPMKQ